MPRVRPKAVQGDPALEAALSSQIAAEQKRQRGAERDLLDSPYGPDSLHSWFADSVIVAESEERASAGLLNPRLHGRDGGTPNPPAPGEPDLEQARARLEDLRFARKMALGAEKRDLSTGDPGGAGVVSNAPAYLGELFASASRSMASLAEALPQRPLPEFGMKVEVPRVESGAAVAVQATENSAVQETDADLALASSNVAMIVGQNDVSRQLFERSMPGIDVLLAADLGRALGAAIDLQLIAGTNASGQTRGLANVSGILAISYTDASPTAAELLSKLWRAYEELSGPNGYGVSDRNAYLIVMHPRRLAMLQAGFSAPVDELVPGRIVASGGIRTLLGAGTNEDEVYVIAREETILFVDPPRIAIFPEVGSGTGTVRIQARQSAALMAGRAPSSIARISGTGLVPATL